MPSFSIEFRNIAMPSSCVLVLYSLCADSCTKYISCPTTNTYELQLSNSSCTRRSSVHFLKTFHFPRTQKLFLIWWNHRTGQLAWNGLLLLNDCITQEHCNNIFVVVQESVSINITQVPNLAQLLFSKSSFEEDVSCNVWG